MGWLVSDRPLTHETPAAYLAREFTCANETNRMEVLAASQVKGAVYLAVRHTSLTGERAGRSYVVGLEQRLQAVAPASRVRPVGTLAWLIGVRIACRRAARRAAKRALRWARILRMLWPQPQRTA